MKIIHNNDNNKSYDKDCGKTGKWFIDLPFLEFRKSLMRYGEIDSLETFFAKAVGFLGRDADSENECLPETPEEAYRLGKMLYDLEVYCDAEDWLRMAAEGGLAEAQVDYGFLLYRGCGRTQSFTEALRWYEAAMEQGSLDGLCRAKQMYRGSGFSWISDTVCMEALKNTTPVERGKSPEKEAEVLERIRRLADEGDPEAVVIYANDTDDMDIIFDAAENGNVHAMRTLSNRYYMHMIGCEDSVDQTVYWAEKAAQLGDGTSLSSMSVAYANGLGVEYNPVKAFEYAEKAVEMGVPGAGCKLARMYFTGTGVERSYQKAREWFMVSSHCSESQYYLGEIFYRGLGVERNDEIAFEWYSAAESNGNTDAKVKLAIMYANGHGTEKDSFATSSLLFDAVEEGNLLARDLEGCF